MTNPFKIIAISLIPNFKFSDVFLSFKLSLQSLTTSNKKPQQQLIENLSKHLNQKYIHLFDSGRVSFYFLLKALDIKKNDEIIIQSFTCSVVPASILWTGATPIFIDVDKTYNLDPKDLKNKITSKTKAVVIQHTFGTPANIDEIQKICKQNKITLIEDCAHGLGNSYKGQKLGSFGKASFYSFGRDKVISGIWGGAVSTNDPAISQKIEELTKNLPERKTFWAFQTLIYPILMYKIIKTYSFLNLGKFLHFVLRRSKILSDAITPKEKEAKIPKIFYKNLPSPVCLLIISQLKKINFLIQHRQKLAFFYSQKLKTEYNPNSSYLRFPLKIENPNKLRSFAASKNIILGDWYNSPIIPKDIDITKFGYIANSCPKTEKLTNLIVNLPTNPNITQKDADKIVKIIEQWKSKK